MDAASFCTLESARKVAHNFCKDRQWEKFHTPVNLLLALNGEVGELIENFQWKGDFMSSISDEEFPSILSSYTLFNEKEYLNIADELSDVFIYSLRLAEIMRIDLAKSIKYYLKALDQDNTGLLNYDLITFTEYSDDNYEWNDLTFLNIEESLTKFINSQADTIDKSHEPPSSFRISRSKLIGLSKNPRYCSLAVQQVVANANSIFMSKPENLNVVGLNSWKPQEISDLAYSMASIIVLLTVIANKFKFNLGKIVYNKFIKNANKYPVSMVKGSSAKYTEYHTAKQKTEQRKSIPNLIGGISIFTVGILLGIYLTKMKRL